MDKQKNPQDYLKGPYSRVLIPDAESGGYTARILELPGCITEGDTPQEALENLESAAESWIAVSLAQGHEIPEPDVYNEYSGKVALRLPRSLHRQAAQLAEREGVSLNEFLVAAIAEKVGAHKEATRLKAEPVQTKR